MSTIAAISTAVGTGGIGIVRISGPEAIGVADKIFKSISGEPLSGKKGYVASYGKIFFNDVIIDDAIALVFRAPHSYTGEDVVELSCHGGVYVVRRVLNAVLDSGAALAQPGEFTKRAFLNGKMDLTQAEAVATLISAKGKKANDLASAAKEGVLNKKINDVKNQLVDLSAELDVWADYPEESIPRLERIPLKERLSTILSGLLKILDSHGAAKAVAEGLRTAIVGRPNVGKSSLLNALAGERRAIVTSVPGTTRDVINAEIVLGDVPLIVSDTAGIRDTDDEVEKIGVEKSVEKIGESELIIAVFDGSTPLTTEDQRIINTLEKLKTIAVVNKVDLPVKINVSSLEKAFKHIVFISTMDGKFDAESLKKAVYDVVQLDRLNEGEPVVSGERQYDVLKRACDLLKDAVEAIEGGITLDAITLTVQDAVETLMELTGERAGDAIIDRIFSKFCVGK